MRERTLAELMSDLARDLQPHPTVEELLSAAVVVACKELDVCDGAAISIVHRKVRIDTPAATSEEARRSDELQVELGEGPCLDAIWEERTVHSPDLRSDDRWPRWGTQMAEHVGYRSMAAFRLYTHSDRLGALNLYSSMLRAFEPADLDYAQALTAHLAVALRSAQHIDQLDEAVLSRTNIGIAMGRIMERYGICRDQAFGLLSRLSSTTNRKLRDVAADIADGGELP